MRSRSDSRMRFDTPNSGWISLVDLRPHESAGTIESYV
jgi:hypothetical protein